MSEKSAYLAVSLSDKFGTGHDIPTIILALFDLGSRAVLRATFPVFLVLMPLFDPNWGSHSVSVRFLEPAMLITGFPVSGPLPISHISLVRPFHYPFLAAPPFVFINSHEFKWPVRFNICLCGSSPTHKRGFDVPFLCWRRQNRIALP